MIGSGKHRGGLPVDDLESLDAVEVPVVGQKRELMLQAERGNPEIVMKALQFRWAPRRSPATFHEITYPDVVRNASGVWSKQLAIGDECLEALQVFFAPRRSRNPQLEFCQDEKR